MADGATGGVATYSRALRRAQRAIDPASLLLRDHAIDGPAPVGWTRLGRWAAATLPFARHATLRARSPGDLYGRDIFRLAQVFFDIHRRPMSVRVPGPPGIMHWSYPLPIRIAGWRNVYTVHDAIPLLQPEFTPIDPRRHRRLLRAIQARAAALVTVSATARSDLARALGCDPARISDCSQVAEPSFASVLPAGLHRDGYLLVLGSIEPRKNVAAILDAYQRSGTALPLVIAGPDGWRAAETTAAIDATPGAIRLHAPDAATVAALLGHARLLLMPSLAEGFGLPVAEAMALGTPVVTSREGALAEIAGGAALLVDPSDPGDIATAICTLLGDQPLREGLIAAGKENARRFTHARFAAALASVYAAVMEASG